jgi:hypothetical protein
VAEGRIAAAALQSAQPPQCAEQRRQALSFKISEPEILLFLFPHTSEP